jgi:hypothetical protein
MNPITKLKSLHKFKQTIDLVKDLNKGFELFIDLEDKKYRIFHDKELVLHSYIDEVTDNDHYLIKNLNKMTDFTLEEFKYHHRVNQRIYRREHQ